MFVFFGLCFGSFALATAWRIKHKRNFVNDTSECESCHHKLAAKDLVPIVSFLSTKGRCRYCKARLSILLPFAEVLGAVCFGLSYLHWPHLLNTFSDWFLFVSWCLALILLLILFFYDLQWFLLPNKVVHPLWLVSGVYFGLSYARSDFNFSYLYNTMFAVVVTSGLFALLYFVSKGKWIGFGDVRLGLSIGLFVSTPAKAALVLFLASLIGILATLPSLLRGKSKMTTKVPFGPLLIIGTIVSVLYGQHLVDWYVHSILLL